jgi:Transcriptional regulators
VREAFRALEQAGLVRTEKNRGVFVRTVSLAEADEIYAVRAVLEEAACRMLASSIDAKKLAVLREWLDAMRARSTRRITMPMPAPMWRFTTRSWRRRATSSCTRPIEGW